MKTMIFALIVLLCALQYKLWFASGSIPTVWSMKQKNESQQTKNNELAKRNQALEAEVKELKLGKDALEEHARSELGMIKQNEEFYQIVEEPSSGN